MVADSALYSAANIALMKEMKWLCRVPLTVGYAKQIISDLALGEFAKSEIDGYSFVVKTSNYGDVKQRWLIVESEQRLANRHQTTLLHKYSRQKRHRARSCKRYQSKSSPVTKMQ